MNGKKEKKNSEELNPITLTTADYILLLRNLQERTRIYVHLFPECGEEANKIFEVLDKEALERAIQALLVLDELSLLGRGETHR